MKKKLLLTFLFIFTLSLVIFPMTAFSVVNAQTPREEALDLIAMETTDSLAAEGWAWNAETKILTLDGLDLSVSSGNAITVPDGTTIILADGSVNTIATSDSKLGICANGDLTIKTADGAQTKGTLNITTPYRGIEYNTGIDVTKNASFSIENIILDITANRGVSVYPKTASNTVELSLNMSGVIYNFTGVKYSSSTIRSLEVWNKNGDARFTLTNSKVQKTDETSVDGDIVIEGSGKSNITVAQSTLSITGKINNGNNKPISAILNINENSAVTTGGELWLATRSENNSEAILSVDKSKLTVKTRLYVGKSYAQTSIATITSGSAVAVGGDVIVGYNYANATNINPYSELTVSASTFTTGGCLYVHRGDVSKLAITNGSTVAVKGSVYVGSPDEKVMTNAELIISDSSLYAGMESGETDSIILGSTYANESSATITNSTVIAVGESIGGIQLYPKEGNTGSLEASDSTFFVASLNGGTEIPDELNNVTTVQFSEPATKNSDGNLILPSGTTIKCGGETYTVAEGNTPTVIYDNAGSMQIPTNTELITSLGTTISSNGVLIFDAGQKPILPAGVKTTIVSTKGNSVELTLAESAPLNIDETGNIILPRDTNVQVNDTLNHTCLFGGIVDENGVLWCVGTVIDNQTYTGFALEPSVYVEKNGVPFTEGLVLEYENNINVGVATVILNIDNVKIYTLTFNIVKANAVIEVDTTSIIATYGQDFELPAATSNFGEVKIDKTIEELKNAGVYTVTYTVIGTDNYNGGSKSVIVRINKADPIVVMPENLEGVGGNALASIELSEGFAWIDGSAVINCGIGQYEIVYTPEDTDNYNLLTAQITVNGVHQYRSLVDKVDPTCISSGFEAHYICSVCRKYFTSEKVETTPEALSLALDPNAHNYAITYVWSEDYSTCSATAICLYDAAHTVTENAKVSSEITQKQGCEEVELTEYTAIFENRVFSKQAKSNVETAEALGHNFSVIGNGILKHWDGCERCSEKTNEEFHNYQDGVCAYCGHVETWWTQILFILAIIFLALFTLI